MNLLQLRSMPTPISVGLRTLLALSSFTLLTACDAQRPPNLPPTPAVATSIAAGDGKSYSEPALMGKIIDAETKRPIQGAFVYGHYATSQGSIGGGSKFGEHVKSFAVETDANGQFKLDPWNTGDRKIGGQPNGKFPMIAVYKPGYALDIQNLNSISQWQAISYSGATRSKTSGAVIDWTASPYELKPTTTEKDRYAALSNAGYPMMMVGECGWELYSGLLLAMHNELKDWYRRNAPSEYLKADGYPNGAMARPIELQRIDMVFESSVDRLLRIAKESGDTSACTDPRRAFQK